jgi:hypothetical protein
MKPSQGCIFWFNFVFVHFSGRALSTGMESKIKDEPHEAILSLRNRKKYSDVHTDGSNFEKV